MFQMDTLAQATRNTGNALFGAGNLCIQVKLVGVRFGYLHAAWNRSPMAYTALMRYEHTNSIRFCVIAD